MDFFDLHCDTITTAMHQSCGLDCKYLDISFPKNEEIKRHAQYFAIFCPDVISGEDAFNYYTMAKHFFDAQLSEFPQYFEQAKKASDICRITESGKTAAILTVEGGRVLGGKIERLKNLFDDGVRMMTLTWNGENEIGKGSTDQTFGLKPFGIEVIKEMALSDKIGAVRLLRANFGFPKRLEGDFRYDKDLGGGALLDCGGYTVKLVSELLGDDAYVADSNLINEDYCVDLYGAVTLKNKKGVVAQVSFGMDNSYVCDFSIWGSKGILEAKRVFTAPPDFMAKVSIIQNGVVVEEAEVEDDHFQRSIEHFYNCIQDGDKREVEYAKILKQGSLVQECFKMSV